MARGGLSAFGARFLRGGFSGFVGGPSWNGAVAAGFLAPRFLRSFLAGLPATGAVSVDGTKLANGESSATGFLLG